MQVIAAEAAFHETLQPVFAGYGRTVVDNAQVLAKMLSAGGLRLFTGGTDYNPLLFDLQRFGFMGEAAIEELERFRLVTNKNVVPFDPCLPAITSGIHFGTPAATSCGFDSAAFQTVGDLTLTVLQRFRGKAIDEAVIRGEVKCLTDLHPVQRASFG